ncbi:hypothetical protein [Echinicola rosea]|uniref:Uncharacterized protein n=1 Tax=Echinicola rosea TaxID=1807691 RepID=A0ABQ1V478_9BACT|nr:hypothetical protein [Echinicola rosea]GGF35738.1 hypothetical protein GCM10011339_25160 [Echinicola rosea]
MKKLVLFHLVTLVPMILILSLYIYEEISTGAFIGMFLVYAMVYRPFFDYKRLKEKELVTKKEFFNTLGFIRFKYLSELLFKK